MKRTILLLTIIISGMFQSVRAQDVAVKTNLLADGFLNPNLGLEIGLAPKWTLDVSGQFNAWTLSHDRRWKHWAIQPEARYWLCDRFAGHFFGIHAHGGQYNMGGFDGKVNFLGTDARKLQDYRYQGWFIGAGVAYGYAWVLGEHWNLEAEIGVGYSYTEYDRFNCAGCGKKVEENKPHHYVGPTKAACKLVYVFLTAREMKKTGYMIIALLLGVCMAAEAQTDKQTVVDGVSVSNLSTEHSGKYMVVDMTLDLSDLDVESKRAVLITPYLVNGSDSLALQSVGVYGRQRYFYYVRNGESMLTEDELSYRSSETPDYIDYSQVTLYEDWMNGATLSIHRGDYGCCSNLLAEEDGALGQHAEKFFPELVYVRPQAEKTKARSIEGTAYVDFVVDKTVINPDYRRNTVELGKIQASIDSVKSDSDVHINSVWLKGFASPESPYSHNRDLASGRTEAVKKYIQQLYKFEDGVISTDYEPENWEGLRRYVEQSNIDNREKILDIIDMDMDPDEKEAKIKSAYPEQYQFLLQNCYPALRRTDYRISYDIRSYSDVEEIKRLMRTRPQNLSEDEFYLVAQEYEPGTEEFTEVFETAVRLYPDDEIANLNAANAAMRRGDNAAAARYLERAGDSAEAVYARGSLAVRNKDYDTARKYLAQAKNMGLEQAAVTLEQIENGRR